MHVIIDRCKHDILVDVNVLVRGAAECSDIFLPPNLKKKNLLPTEETNFTNSISSFLHLSISFLTQMMHYLALNILSEQFKVSTNQLTRIKEVYFMYLEH